MLAVESHCTAGFSPSARTRGRRERNAGISLLGQVKGDQVKLSDRVEPFYGPLDSIQHLLSRFGERGVVIGGVAASLLGKPRFTVDVDAVFLLSIEELPQFIEAAKSEGVEPRIGNAEEFARKNRVLLLKHSATGTHIDISRGRISWNYRGRSCQGIRALDNGDSAPGQKVYTTGF